MLHIQKLPNYGTLNFIRIVEMSFSKVKKYNSKIEFSVGKNNLDTIGFHKINISK